MHMHTHTTYIYTTFEWTLQVVCVNMLTTLRPFNLIYKAIANIPRFSRSKKIYKTYQKI